MENNTENNKLQKEELSKELLKESSSKYELPDNLLKEITEIRQYLHKNPELSGEEYKTTEFIKKFLTEHDIKILPFDLKTGVIAEIGEGEKIVALRADIDALPINEMTDYPYKSQNPGVMHACGHDFHTASLLGAAVVLKQKEKELKDRVRLIFQPAEEINAGAKEVIKSGVLEGVSAIAGFHNKPDLPLGTIGIKSGPLMAAVDRFEVKINGTGTHAAAPQNGNDPIVTASQIVTSIQSIVSRYVSPVDMAIISVTKISGGNTWNVIPESVIMEGTMRTFKESVQERIKKLFVQVIKNYTEAFDQKYEISWGDAHSFVDNDKILAEAIGKEASIFADVKIPEITTGGEDFSFYQKEVPGLFAFIGTGCPYEWHNPAFQIKDEALYFSINYYIAAVNIMLKK